MNQAFCEYQSRQAFGGQLALKRVHLVGISGSGMHSLADLLDEAGWHVSGSDLAPATPWATPIDIWQGHDAAHIDESIDIVVYSDAVSRDNPELVRARELGIHTLSYPRMLAWLMQSRRGVAIAGTHGKSTTTAMVGDILLAEGSDPAIVVGAKPVGKSSGGRFGNSPWMVVEACEYQANFHAMTPEVAAILNVEPDHFDCYATQEELENAFEQFARQVPPSGMLIARHDCAATRRVVAELACPFETFGITAGATWRAEQIVNRSGYYNFELWYREQQICKIHLPVPGIHNVLNAVAAAAVASHCGASGDAIRQGLERFAGLKRRLQLLGEVSGVVLIDDFAHHPTEVEASLATVRQMYPDRRLVCVFQPHQGSRLVHLLDEFVLSLHNADTILVGEVYRPRIDLADSDGLSAAVLSERLLAAGSQAKFIASLPEIQEHLKNMLQPGDVLVAMGAGDIGNVAHELGKGLRTFRKAS